MLAAALATAASPAAATWSVIGVDPATGEVGVGVASCVPDPVTPVAVLVPGRGAAANQAEENLAAGPALVQSLTDGAAPGAALASVVDEDPDSAIRQYGYVSLTGGAGGHTGAEVPTEALAALSGDGRAAVQGNTLASPAVVTDALAAYEAADGSLADRLLAALLAGAAAGGDARCGEQRSSAAALAVARPGDVPWVVADESQDLAALPAPSLLLSEVSDTASATDLLAASYQQRATARPEAAGNQAAGSPEAARPGAGSTAAGSTGAGSTAAGSTAAGSTGAGSTAAGSTGAGSTAAGSTAAHPAQLAALAVVAVGAACAAAWAVRRRAAGADRR